LKLVQAKAFKLGKVSMTYITQPDIKVLIQRNGGSHSGARAMPICFLVFIVYSEYEKIALRPTAIIPPIKTVV